MSAVVRSDNIAGQENAGQRLRLLSYNIQTGTSTTQFRDYLTHSWRHVLPSAQRMGNLDLIARMINEYDLVGLQEVDAGSLRSGFINQTEYLAHRANFPFWFHQTNRKFGKFAQHSNGILSKIKPAEISDHKLPGPIPGRGALFVRYGHADASLVVVILHLALGSKARMRQLQYVAEVASDFRHVVVMGDMNCKPDSKELQYLFRTTDLGEPANDLYTWPSWRPHRNIDHILVSSSLKIEKAQVLSHTYSDHLPLSVEIILPDDLNLYSTGAGHVSSPG